jgi:hypothetical protein
MEAFVSRKRTYNAMSDDAPDYLPPPQIRHSTNESVPVEQPKRIPAVKENRRMSPIKKVKQAPVKKAKVISHCSLDKKALGDRTKRLFGIGEVCQYDLVL